MRNRNGVMPIGIIGIIVVAFSLAVFFLLDIEKSTLNLWALALLLLSEIVLFGGLIGLRFTGANHSKVFLNSGITVTLLLYFVATLISVLFAGAFMENLNTFFLIQLAIIALFVIITIFIFVWSRGITRHYEIDMAKIGTNEPKRGGF